MPTIRRPEPPIDKVAFKARAAAKYRSTELDELLQAVCDARVQLGGTFVLRNQPKDRYPTMSTEEWDAALDAAYELSTRGLVYQDRPLTPDVALELLGMSPDRITIGSSLRSPNTAQIISTFLQTCADAREPSRSAASRIFNR